MSTRTPVVAQVLRGLQNRACVALPVGSIPGGWRSRNPLPQNYFRIHRLRNPLYCNGFRIAMNCVGIRSISTRICLQTAPFSGRRARHAFSVVAGGRAKQQFQQTPLPAMLVSAAPGATRRVGRNCPHGRVVPNGVRLRRGRAAGTRPVPPVVCIAVSAGGPVRFGQDASGTSPPPVLRRRLARVTPSSGCDPERVFGPTRWGPFR